MFVASKGYGFDVSFDVAFASMAESCATRKGYCAVSEISDVVFTSVHDLDELLAVLGALAMPFTVGSGSHRFLESMMAPDSNVLIASQH